MLAISFMHARRTMETQEVGGSASPHGAQDTEVQDYSLAHRQRLVDVDRALCTAQPNKRSKKEPR